MHWWKQLAAAVALVLSSTAFAAEPTEPVNINTAGAEALAQAISGVGIKRAQSIVQYRDEHGAFATVDELTKVRGIGPATVDKNRDRITVGTVE